MSRKNFPLRLNPDVYAAVERWAADDLRSVNAQIEYLLTQMLKQHGRLKPPTSPPEPSPVPSLSEGQPVPQQTTLNPSPTTSSKNSSLEVEG